jgi:chloramphenicol O-acetyltransferase type A
VNSENAQYLDSDAWHRRSAFDFFRSFDIPSFNLCARLDVAQLKQAVNELGVGSLSLAYHFIAIRLANDIAPFRYRLEGDRVRVHAAVHGSTTVLRDDDSFGFATLEYNRDFAAFCTQGRQALANGRLHNAPFEPDKYGTAAVHMTTLPWVHFTSYSNARKWGPNDSIPKIAFGRIDADGARQWMPLSVEVHHALMDGLHIGRFFEGFEAALLAPEAWLQGGSATA